MADLAVETRGLVRAFGAQRAVDGVDLAIPHGSFYGIAGPNGAGKSTTLRMLVRVAGTLLERDPYRIDRALNG